MKAKSVLILLFCAIMVVIAYFVAVRGKEQPSAVVTVEESPVLKVAGEETIENVEMTPEKLDELTTATAQITRGDKSVLTLRAVDHETESVILEPNELLNIRLVLKNPEAGREVLIEADHGGSLNHRLGPLVIALNPGEDTIEFEYAVGGHNGRYTLLVSQGNRQELIEFRVGAEPPLGAPGPQRTFTFEHTLK